MEGKRILQQILRGDVQQSEYIQNYLSPLEKILGSELVNCVGAKISEHEEIVSKYGTFCMKLLRCCIEVLSKENLLRLTSFMREECFKCSEIGASVLTKLITSGINLPADISITALCIKFYHLTMAALKEEDPCHLLFFTDCLANIGRKAAKVGESCLSRDTFSIYKQTSNHLWNGAIKLEQLKSEEKNNIALTALFLRNNSLKLLSLTGVSLSLLLERGLMAARRFQHASCLEEQGPIEMQKFHFFLLYEAVTICDNGKTSPNDELKDGGAYNLLEDLCVSCCKVACDTSHFGELLELFLRLVETDTKASMTCKGRLRVFLVVLQILFCSLCLRLKDAKNFTNLKIKEFLKWSTLQKRLFAISEVLENMDSNLYFHSQILQAMDYLTFTCKKLFDFKADEERANVFEKIPLETMSILLNTLFVLCHIQGKLFKSKKQHSSPQLITSCSTLKAIVRSRLSMLHLVSSLAIRNSIDLLVKTPQNGRKLPAKFDFVSAMAETKAMLDDVLDEMPAGRELYRCVATDAFKVGLALIQRGQIHHATSLARLSCEAANTWCRDRERGAGIREAMLFSKYELLSECLEKQSQWNEALQAMTQCCQLYALCTADFADTGSFENEMMEYVEKWSTRKHRALNHLGEGKAGYQIKQCILSDGWKELVGADGHEKEMFTLLQMELETYRRKRYCTSIEELAVIEQLEKLFMKSNDLVNACSVKVDKVRLMYQMDAKRDEMDSDAHCRQNLINTCREIIADLSGLSQHKNPLLIQDILASSYFWCFVLQYSMAVQQTGGGSARKDSEQECNDAENPDLSNKQDIYEVMLSLRPDFMLSLHSAVEIWTGMVDTMSKSDRKVLDALRPSETCWKLQIASSVYGFLNMPLMRIHTLSVLAAMVDMSGVQENLQTAIVAHSMAIQTLCDEGNVLSAELLTKHCEAVIERLGDDCQPVTRYFFFIAKSQVFLLKGMYDDGWHLVKEVLGGMEHSRKPIAQFVLLKVKLLCFKYLSLPPSLCETQLRDSDGCSYFELLLQSLKHAEALVDYFVNDSGRTKTDFAGLNTNKEQRGILLSHWSVLNELLRCLMEVGKGFLLQGAVREAKTFLELGGNFASRFSSSSRLSEFVIQLAELNLLKNNTELYEMCLKQAQDILRPGSSTCDLLSTDALSAGVEHSPFTSYDEILEAKLRLQLLVAYCQYLKLTGKLSDVKTVCSSLRELRQTSIEKYEQSLEFLERVLAGTRGVRSVKAGDESLHANGARRTKAKGKRGKTVTKSNGTGVAECLPGKHVASSVVFLDCGLKVHALESDVALNESDFTTLLSSVQEGLKLAESTQESVKDPFLLDLMSTSLLHYLRGVAYMLSSSAGFALWNVAGRTPSGEDRNRDFEDTSEEMSCLDLSRTLRLDREKRFARTFREKIDDGSEDFAVAERMLKETSSLDDWEYFSEEAMIVDSSKVRKRAEGRCNGKNELESEKAFQKLPVVSRKKGSRKKKNVAVLDEELEYEDMSAEKEHQCSKKNSGRPGRKGVITKFEESITKSATKTKRNASRKKHMSTIFCDEDCKTPRNQTGLAADEIRPKRNQATRNRSSTKTSRARNCQGNYSDVDILRVKQTTAGGANIGRNGDEQTGGQEKQVGSWCENDEEFSKAVECFQRSLDSLYPYYNPVLLTRLCQALVLCYGSSSPVNAAAYHNLAMATTLRHQAMLSCAKKISKLNDGQLTRDDVQGGNKDKLVRSVEALSLGDSRGENLGKRLQLETIKKTIDFKTSSEEILESFNHSLHLLPHDWTMCTLSIVPAPERKNIKHLVVTRLRKKEKPVVLKLTLPNDEDEEDDMEEEFHTNHSVVRDLSAVFRKSILSDFDEILRENGESLSVKKAREWWSRRGQIDNQLQRLVQRLEDSWFGRWRGVLCGRILEEEHLSQLKSDVEQLQHKAVEVFGVAMKNEQLLELLCESYGYLKAPEVTSALADLTGLQKNSAQVTKESDYFRHVTDDTDRKENSVCVCQLPYQVDGSGNVMCSILSIARQSCCKHILLDNVKLFARSLKQFFSQNVDRYYTGPVRRGPVVLILDKVIQHLPFESMPILRDLEVSRMPSLQFVTSNLVLQSLTASAPVGIFTSGVDTRNTYYVLNPKNDLPRTEKMFQDWFAEENGWSGVVGRAPSCEEFKEALSSHDLFLYFGHGNGHEFLKGDQVQRLCCQAVAVLMGCSSGKLIVQGNCDARGMVLHYLLSGCPAVVANLWDVTDGDIDRFSDALLKTWLKKDNKLSLTECVTQCRSACRLKYLIGSSPVVYGMPVYTRNAKK